MITKGVYKIINIVNSKVYIGSSVNYTRRKNRHFNELKINKHHSPHLQRAYNKYGKENFKMELIEELIFPEDYDKILVKEHLLNREQYYKDLYQSYKREFGYDVLEKADSNLGLKYSKEVRDKMSIRMKERWKNDIPFRNSVVIILRCSHLNV